MQWFSEQFKHFIAAGLHSLNVCVIATHSLHLMIFGVREIICGMVVFLTSETGEEMNK